MGNIILKDIKVDNNVVSYKFEVSAELSKYFNSDTLWIEFDENLCDCPKSILTIPFVSIMLPIMWVTDSVLWVDDLDYTFYHATFFIQNAYQNLYRNHELKGRLVPSNLTRNEMKASDDSFILFSGGVDAHTTYIRNRNEISRLVNIQGFYSNPQEPNKVAETDKKDISNFAKAENLNASFIKSNFAVLISEKSYKPYAKIIGDSLWHGFQHSMAFISFTIPLAFKHHCSKILIASSFTVGDGRVCASYPTTDNEFCFATNGHAIHDGFELTRQEKIKVITDHQRAIARPYPIRVCSFNDHNCCECEKCFRTILGIVAEGADIKDFGFYYPEESLTKHWINVLNRKAGLMGFHNEAITHWPHIIKRMKENYQIIEDKEFVDWFLTFDFAKSKRKGMLKYYRKNFFSILKRKLSTK